VVFELRLNTGTQKNGRRKPVGVFLELSIGQSTKKSFAAVYGLLKPFLNKGSNSLIYSYLDFFLT
jgi:hypothetical protein